MRKLLMFFIPLFILGCTKKEESPYINLDDTASQLFTKQYSVTDSSVMSSDEIFKTSISSVSNAYGVDISNDLLDKFTNAVNNMQSTDSESSLGYKTVKITYTTKDESDEDVTVSALIVYPVNKEIDKVMLINHGTNVGKFMVPTNYTTPDILIAATGALCVLPDYIGLGVSSSHKDLYLNSEIAGRTSTDALLALFAYAYKNELPLSKTYDTYVLGYSQGGEVSLATLKTIQSLSQDLQDVIRLKKVICGDGPYDLLTTYKNYEKDDKEDKVLGFPCVVPRVISSMFNSYPEDFDKYNYEDFFSKWALETGVPQAIRNNTATEMDLTVKLANCSLSDILNMDYISSKESGYQTLLAAMDKQNLCTGWTPKYPIHFLHCNPDGVVPYENYENAMEEFEDSEAEIESDTPSSSIIKLPLLQHIYGLIIFLSESISGSYFK